MIASTSPAWRGARARIAPLAGPRLAVLVGTVLLWPRAALAAAEGGAFVWEIANLALLLGVIGYFARKPLLSFLAERRETIAGDMESAEKQLRAAEERLDEWTRRESGLEAEAEEIRRAAREAAEREAATILADARAAAERIRESAHAAVESELRRAHQVLRAEAADLAVEHAATLLRERIGEDDQDRLVEEFVTRLEGGEAR